MKAWVEHEPDGEGGQALVATIILDAPRCTFSCTHCDLWKHALPHPSPVGSIVRQVARAQQQTLGCRWIKLYNGGNFSDPQSIPREDRSRIAEACGQYDRVIVENHPNMPWEPLVTLASQIQGRLEVAMGLESADPFLLKGLNKRMTLDDFCQAAQRYLDHEIDVRTFVIHGLPGIPYQEQIHSSLESVSFAFSAGSRHVSVIPMRNDPSAKEAQVDGATRIEQLEQILQTALTWKRGVVTIDTWDLDWLLPEQPERIARIKELNLSQLVSH